MTTAITDAASQSTSTSSASATSASGISIANQSPTHTDSTTASPSAGSTDVVGNAIAAHSAPNKSASNCMTEEGGFVLSHGLLDGSEQIDGSEQN
jgi:hypothetical protein